MGAYTMRCSLNFLSAVMILAAPAVGLAQSSKLNVGKPLSQEEIKSFDFMIGPQGQQLPPGRGTAKEGAVIFAKRCEVCHGQNGEKGVLRRLVLGSPGKPYRGPFKDTEKDSIAYYPYATIAWDYINRAMPVPKPGSLTHDEVYSVVAFLLYRNGIIQETDVMDQNSLPKVEMPNRHGFVPEVPVYPPDPTAARTQNQLGFVGSGGYTGTAGTKPFRFGISTFGRLLESMTSVSWMMPFR
jgi:mono/diheme cytochrome c family protein